MGALHAGHLQLVRQACKENDFVSVSIFINPTQFNNQDDLATYPIQIEEDLKALKQEGVSLVFLPTKEIMYPDDYKYKISETTFSKKLCGANRPGHFDGVLSIVMKLLNLLSPENAYFGEKDFQQLQLIRGMVEAFFIKTKIKAVTTLREKDGLAMSSRNQRLIGQNRKKAALIAKLIQSKKTDTEIAHELSGAGFQVDYVNTINDRRFIAASLADVRLIDNMEII